MCGIAGIIDYKNAINPHDGIYGKMLNCMANRGPDDEGVFFEDNCLLLHKRLAVVDPASSRQPMQYEKNGRLYTIVYNGELYNTHEIRADLLKKGFQFNTKGDTEVVLCAYIAYGEGCLDIFNGIFAFAIWDSYEKTLFFARDAMGVKPFFYFSNDKEFIFASTVPTLLLHPHVPHTIDAVSVSEILLLGPGRTPGNAIFSEIHELPAGFCGRMSMNGLEISRYFQLVDKPHPHNFTETVEHVKCLVRDAILRQTVSDVPLGTFLSGGLDSSIISAVTAEAFREKGKTLDTFSVNYKNQEKFFKASHFQPDSDEKYIEIMANHIKSNHHEVVLDTEDIIPALYLVIDEKGLPAMADVDSSLLAFCKKIRKNVTVALSGECADEIFGGYPWYRDKDIRNTKGFPWAQNTAYRLEFVSQKFQNEISSDYVANRYKEALANVSLIPGLTDDEKRMREMFRLNIDHFMQTLLFRKDSCSMYASLEVRVPFCDRRICEYMYSVPWEYKNYMEREKGLLRHAAEGILPHDVLWRKKSPYPKTHNPGYLSALREIFSTILKEKDNPLWDIVNIKKAEGLLSQENPQPWYGQLMTTPQTIAYFIQLEYWLDKFSVSLRRQ